MPIEIKFIYKKLSYGIHAIFINVNSSLFYLDISVFIDVFLEYTVGFKICIAYCI